MYYEETIIDGVLHYRTFPYADFQPMTLEQLTKIVNSARNDREGLLQFINRLRKEKAIDTELHQMD